MLCVLGGFSGGAALAQSDPLPDFATCMDIAMARYEEDLDRLRNRPEAERDFDIGDVRDVNYCGTVGIVLCDRSEAPIPCQQALAAEQDALRATILGLVPAPMTQDATQPAPEEEPAPDTRPRAEPAPDAVPAPASPQPARASGFAETLYAQVWHLARGSSAGPDCAGMDPQLEAWCEAREANNRLRPTVLLWQVARYLDSVPPAIETGWANPPPPTRPRMRPEPLP
jgi:hypothetical protein